MVFRMMEGFETKRATTTKLSALYTVAGTPGYTGGRKAGFGAQSATVNIISEELVSPDENIWIVGFAVRKTTDTVIGASSTAGVQLRNAAGEQCSLVLIAEGSNFKLRLKRGSTTIDTTVAAFQWGGVKSWHYFQLKVTCRTGMNGAYELRSYAYFGGAQIVEMSGTLVNLAEQAVDGADRVKIDWNTDGGANIVFDDIVVLDSTGAQNNNLTTKPYVIFGALPNGEGNQLDWTAPGGTHWVLLDDPATSTSDTDKITAQVIGNIDLLNYEDFAEINVSGTAVKGVQVVSSAAMVASGQRTLRVRVRESAAEATGGNFVVNDLILRSFRQMFDQNPTGVPADWTHTTLEAAEFGVEIQA